ncbi:MAG TPA: sensor histidine kinase [Solirubrobacteraceae bacterium]|nr:sensor histidine kinase [Solirubrobacteraceae bacterium]
MNLGRTYRGLSLYVRVVIVNASVLLVPTLLLSLTPAYVPFPGSVTDVLVLVLGLLVVIAANALLLRLTFTPLAGLADAMREIDLLRPGARLQASGGAEITQVIATFNEMLDRLEHERFESNRRTHLALEAERRRIGHELHDEIGQRLTGILLELQRTLDHDCLPATRTELGHVQELTRGILDDVGRIAWQMRPGILDDLGISKALEALVDGVAETAPAAVSLCVEPLVPECGPDVEIVLYRVAQEGLTNALRHSRASDISLQLAPHDGGGVKLEVNDNGHGLDPTAAEGPGLRGMRERALSIGAELTIESLRGSGATVRLVVADTGVVI